MRGLTKGDTRSLNYSPDKGLESELCRIEFRMKGLGFRVQGSGCAGEVALSGLKRPWPYACTPSTRTTFD